MPTPAIWMSENSIQNKTLGEIILPGTHDSGSYSLQQALSQITYPDIYTLWNISQQDAPVNNSYPWQNINPLTQQPYIYIGPAAVSHASYQYAMDIALVCGQSQNSSIYQQLNDGIRYFDLRIYWDTNLNGIYVQHALIGCSFNKIIQDVANYIKANPAARELIILEISHTNFNDNPGGLTLKQLTEEVNEILKNEINAGNFYIPADANIQSSLYNTRLSDITNSSVAGTKIIVMNTDSGYNYDQVAGNVVISAPGFAKSAHSTAGYNDVSDLKDVELQGLIVHKNNPGNLYQVQWTLTVQQSDVVDTINQLLTDASFSSTLKNLATMANEALADFIANEVLKNGYSFNLLTCDWYNLPMSATVADMIIEMNFPD